MDSRSKKRGHGDVDDFLSPALEDSFQLESSFLQDDLLDIPHIESGNLLGMDPAGDAFPGLDDLFSDELVGGSSGSDLPLDFLGNSSSPPQSKPASGFSPTTSESGNAALGPQQPAPRGGGESNNTSAEQDEEAKRLARMQRNRENAFLSRQRKKQQMQELQQSCSQLKKANTQLTCLVHRMVAENCLLRHHLGMACKKAGIPVPEVPSVMKAGAAAAGLTPGMAAAAPAAAAPVDPAPGVLLQQPQPQAVAPAAAPKPASASAAAATTRGRKRARVTSASAAFIAMFSLFMFVGPIAPASTSSNAITTSAAVGLLPAAAVANTPLLPAGGRQGRSLLQVSIEDSEPLLPATPSMINATLEALLHDPRSQAVSDQALQRLQELAPAAVVLDTDEEASRGSSANPLAAATAFPMLAEQFFGAAGLEAPRACRKVFEFEAAALPHPARSRRSVERFITNSYGFKGRSIGGGKAAALQLPAAGKGTDSATLSVNGDQRLLLGEEHSRKAETIENGEEQLPEVVGEPTLVSVLLPANTSQSGGNGGGFMSAIDRVFVVLLHPGDKFVTYSCGLSRPLLI